MRHREWHRTDRIGWLRAAVLGANDGIVSTASLVLGVAAAHGTHGNVMVAGIAGLVAGAMSMAAGEYVSVRSQADSEQAALDVERAELEADDQGRAAGVDGDLRGPRPRSRARETGRRATDGPRRAGRACARRARHLRDAQGATDSGGAYLRRQLRRWRGHAAAGSCGGLCDEPDSASFPGFRWYSLRSWAGWPHVWAARA